MNAHLPSLGDEKLRMDISAAMVDLYSQYFPSRATMADTFINRNTVLCVLEEIFDETELASIKNGCEREVLKRRAEIQESVKGKLTGAVERLTDRRVTAFMSMNHADPAIAAERFFLERDSARGGHRSMPESPSVYGKMRDVS